MNQDYSGENGLWGSFLPRTVARQLGGRAWSGADEEGRVSACGLFVDISGFTPMSEALGAYGPYGTEELTTLLNRWFGLVIELVNAYGGDVAGFGGDALIGIFPINGRRLQPTLRRAVQCALEVQSQFEPFASLRTSAGAFALRMKAGISGGKALWTTVGDPKGRLTYAVAGSALERAAGVVDFASQDEVVLDHKDVERIGRAVWGRETKSGRVVRKLRGAPAPESDLGTISAISAHRAFVHPRVAELLEAGHAHFINEHRRVTVMFVGFRGPDYDDDPDAGKKLRDLFGEAGSIIELHGGYLEQIEAADKGSKFIALFGAPVAMDKQLDRALDCALGLINLSHLEPRIGITTGRVFSGLIGNEFRREYVVIGDSVNIAARLMQRATPLTVLVDHSTREGARRFRWSVSESIVVKGKHEPLAVSRLQSKRPSPALPERHYELPFLGRAHELKTAHRLLKDGRAGRGQIICISGDAGIGKSRFSAEILSSAHAMEFTTFAGISRSYGATTGYVAWQPVIRGLLQLPAGHLTDRHIEDSKEKLRELEESFVPRFPLLAPVLGIAIPDTDATVGLEPEIRVQSMRSMVLDLLRHHSGHTPLMLLFEDCQWFDQASLELLEFIGRNLTTDPIVLVVVYRSPSLEATPAPGLRLRHTTFVHLTALDEDDAEQLALSKVRSLGTMASDVAGDVAAIAQKGEGNPFYIEELVNYLYGHRQSPHDRHETVPTTLTDLITARLDGLKEQERTTLKVASVVGRTFTPDWIEAAYPEVGSPTDIASYLTALESLDLTPKGVGQGTATYTFKHALIQQVAYESMTFDARAMLHERLGEFIESRFHGQLTEHIDELAHHYGHSRNEDKQRTFFQLAADRAQNNFANDSAIEYYEQLLSLLSPDEQSAAHRHMGEVLQLVGRWREAEEAYRSSLRFAERTGDTKEIAEGQAALGHLASYTQSFATALPWLTKARRGFGRLKDAEGTMRVLEYLTHTYFELADYGRAIDCATKQLQIASELQDEAAKSLALENLGRTNWYRGNMELALDLLQQALDTAEKAGNRKAIIHACNDIAGLYSELGDGVRAMGFLERALDTATQIGYRLLSGMSIGNAGHLYRERGQNGHALLCYTASLAIAAELSDLPGISAVLSELGVLKTRLKEYDSAERFFDMSTRLGSGLVSPPFLCETLLNRAACSLKAERPQASTSSLEEALVLAQRPDCHEYLLPCQLLEIELDLKLSKRSKLAARRATEALLEEWYEDRERASILYQLWQLSLDEEPRRQSASLYLELYNSTSVVEYKDRFESLTGGRLGDPDPLPSLDLTDVGAPGLEAILEQISELLSLQQAS